MVNYFFLGNEVVNNLSFIVVHSFQSTVDEDLVAPPVLESYFLYPCLVAIQLEITIRFRRIIKLKFFELES